MLTSCYSENQSLLEDEIEANDLNQIQKFYGNVFVHGKRRIKTSYSENWEYWSGYSQGNREYWCKKREIELSKEF